MQDQLPLAPATLSAIAPVQLVSHRTQRSTGTRLSVSLAEFNSADQATIGAIYQALTELLSTLEAAREDAAVSPEMIRMFTRRVSWGALIKAIQQLGHADDQQMDQRLSAVMHDLRGGSLTALAVNMQLLELGMLAPNDSLRLFFLTRDHLKMMRNGIYDLDGARYQRDLQQRPHSIRLLVEKWSAASYRLQNHVAEIVVDCRFDGIVSERCIEFAALDRVLYNLINNAVRFAANSRVYLSILPLETGQDVRFVVYNQATAEHQQRLHERFGDDLGQLFRGGFTTGGSGLGMRICAEFVMDAYGVGSVDRCVAEGYLGAQLREDHFIAWFHWPLVAD